MRTVLSAVLIALPAAAFAAGGDETPPKPTKTTKECAGKRVWDDKKGRCVRAQNSSLDEQGLYDAVRELAYAGRLLDAQAVLAAMPDQQDDRVLTYWGFTHRKLGGLDVGMQFYQRALAVNPDNILARSYMGQGLLEAGDLPGAKAQLAEIRARGGKNTWAERSLAQAIQTGKSYNY